MVADKINKVHQHARLWQQVSISCYALSRLLFEGYIDLYKADVESYFAKHSQASFSNKSFS